LFFVSSRSIAARATLLGESYGASTNPASISRFHDVLPAATCRRNVIRHAEQQPRETTSREQSGTRHRRFRIESGACCMSIAEVDTVIDFPEFNTMNFQPLLHQLDSRLAAERSDSFRVSCQHIVIVCNIIVNTGPKISLDGLASNKEVIS
jgi:hypothetical protein